MNFFSGKKNAQRGAALILFATVLVMGVAWYAVGALGKAPVATAEREVKTGLALQAAKQALLGYVAQYAARTDHDKPGRLPCPESLNSIGTANEGQAVGNCGNAAVIGRLPWQTLGINQLRDGYGEPLWYAISPGFRTSVINFGTTGQLTYNGAANAAVAVIIAPGRPLNTVADPAALPGWCPAKVNQGVAARNTAPLAAANFLECGNATGAYLNPGTSQWTNDRALAITAAEWADAIAAGVADRMQRQVAPALEDWRATESVSIWGSSFLPYASTFSDPTSNDLCGDSGVREGLPPFAPDSLSGCPRFTASSSAVLGLISLGCTQSAVSADCSFLRLFGMAPFSVRVTATALAAGGFRQRIAASDVTVTNGGAVSTFNLAYNGASGVATATIDATWPIGLGFFSVVTVSVPHLPDAAWMSDARVAWFYNNDWARYAYYGVAQAVVPGGGGTCVAGTNCLVVTGLPTSNGNTNDKKLVLVLTGRQLSGTTWPSATVGNYFEGANATTGDRTYETKTAATLFNDRVAACPFQQTPASGPPVTICN